MYSSCGSLDSNGVNAGDFPTRWKGILLASLRVVLRQVHESLTADEEALRYVEILILRLLDMLCSKPSPPHTIADVEERVQRSFPNPIDRWALTEANRAIEKGRKKSSLVLPVDKIHTLLQKEVLLYKVDYIVTVYIVAVLEYISADILKLAGKYVKNIHHVEVTREDIVVAMWADKVLMDLFYQDAVVGGPMSMPEERTVDFASLTYDEVVKDMIAREKQYRRELHMIIEVFRSKMMEVHPVPEDVDVIFSNILDIEEVTLNLLSSLEDSVEMTEENQNLAVGSCFLEFAEVEEFAVYEKFAKGVLSPEAREMLNDLLSKSHVSHALTSAGHGFLEAVKYVLPKLLLSPIYHCLEYLDCIRSLLRLSNSEEDKESLEESSTLLKPLETELERVITLNNLPPKGVKRFGDHFFYCSHRRTSRQDTLKKLSELQKSIDGWESKETGQSCNEFIHEGVLRKLGARKQVTERHVFLFDGLMILCKHNLRRTSVTGGSAEFRLKEKFYLRKVEIIDRENTEDLKHAFEIAPRLQPSTVLVACSAEEKNAWMAALIRLNTRCMLERTLDSILLDEEKKHPLTLPPLEKYRFSEEDSPLNIVETKDGKGGVPIIKGATLSKLVERLTYHLYADPNFAKVFLTTYRSFCAPHELLDLLVERFDIPEFPFTTEPGSLELSASDREKAKRFRNEYMKPVQFRVLNVIRQWVDRHFYDFRRDPTLLDKLNGFLDQIRGKSMRKWLDSIHKIIKRREEPGEEQREITYGDKVLPPIEHHLNCSEEDFQVLPLVLLQLHPIEMARQITLLEFELYRAVQPSELVGCLWTKREKHLTSPNLLKMIHHTDNMARWMQKCIIETENLEERVAVVCRLLEIMIVFQELNNFNGVLAVVSAIDSASVHRLQFTFPYLPPSRLKALEEARDLSKDHFKKYVEKLRSVNPPCVPFFGMYLTNILYIENGNPDMLAIEGAEIINFNKRRKVAEITGEIQQFQNQPYMLNVEPRIRSFFVNLRPFGDQSEREISDFLYEKSLEIEPRNVEKPPKFPRRWPHLPLKSPGIEPRHCQKNPPYPLSLGDRIFSSSRSLVSGDSVEEVEAHATHSPLTPPSPSSSTPSTPTPDSAVFALVQFGGPAPGGPGLPPPPLPPRSARKQRDAVERRGDGSPPPLPPRRISAPLDTVGKPPLGLNSVRPGVAPVYNGMAGTPPTPTSGLPKAPMPLPSSFDHHIPHGTFVYPPPGGFPPAQVTQPPAPPLPMQPPPGRMPPGASAVGPELPPKTYRQNQAQQKPDSNHGPLHSPGYYGAKR